MSSKTEALGRFVYNEFILAGSHQMYPQTQLQGYTTERFQRYTEKAAVGYLEGRAITAVVASVLGASDPAVPFVVAGIKVVLDAEYPALVRVAYEYPQWVGGGTIGLILLALWLWGRG